MRVVFEFDLGQKVSKKTGGEKGIVDGLFVNQQLEKYVLFNSTDRGLTPSIDWVMESELTKVEE